MSNERTEIPRVAQDADLVNSEAALRRAAHRARERARRTSGYVVIFQDGEIVVEHLAPTGC